MDNQLTLARRAQNIANQSAGRDFEHLTHAEQFRIADNLRVSLSEVNAALDAARAFERIAAHERAGRRAVAVPSGLVVYDVHTGLTSRSAPSAKAQRKAAAKAKRAAEDAKGRRAAQAVLDDPRAAALWSTVVVLESKLGITACGDKVDRYLRVGRMLDKLERQEKRGKLSASDAHYVRRYASRLRATEDAYWQRAMREAGAYASLRRQAAAVAGANKLAAI